MTDEDGMRAALREAENGLAAGEPPFGAALFSRSGLLLAAGYDTVRCDGDWTRHAEIETVRAACEAHGAELVGSTLFTTVEPCPMCFTAAWLARVSRIIFGAAMTEVFAVTGERQRELTMPAHVVNQASSEPIVLASGVLQAECLALFQRTEAYPDV